MRVIYGILGFLLLGGAIEGGRLNLEQIASGQGLPQEPERRGAYILGMFTPTVGCGALGLWLAVLAFKQPHASRRQPTELKDTDFQS